MAEPRDREDLDLWAGEYVVGLLDHDERQRARALIEADATMRSLVARWEERLTPLNVGYVATSAPDIWPALDRTLFATRRRRNRFFWVVVVGLGVALVVKLAFWVQLLF